MSGGGLELLPEWKRCHIFLKCPRGSWGGSGALVSVDAGPQFPEDYTRGPEEVSVLLCGCDHTYTQIVTEGSEEAAAPVTLNAAPSFQKPQLIS